MKSSRPRASHVGLMILVLAALAFGLAASRGALGIARDDDWSYLNVVFQAVESGGFGLNGWVHMMFVTQGFVGMLVAEAAGQSIVAMQMSVLMFGVGGLFVVYWLSRFVVGGAWSLTVVAITGLSPLWLFLSVTFMTDIPTWTLSGLSLALGIHATLKESRFWLTIAACIGLLAFGIREYGVVPLLVLLVWIAALPAYRRLHVWALSLLVLASTLCVLGYVWRQGLPGSIETEASSPAAALSQYSRLLLSLALLLFPYIAIGVLVLWSSRIRALLFARRFWIGLALGFIAGLGIAYQASGQLIGNVIHPYGSSWTSAGDGVRSLPLWIFRAIELLGVASLAIFLATLGAVLQMYCSARISKSSLFSSEVSRIVALFCGVCAAVMVTYLLSMFLVGAPGFDRYLLLVVPLLGIVILTFVSRLYTRPLSIPQRTGVFAVLLITGIFGVVVSDNLNQIDGLRWKSASNVVSAGVPAFRVDAGDAWFRYHQSESPEVDSIGSLENKAPGRTWWQTFFNGATFCRMVAIESESDLEATYGEALSIEDHRTLLGIPFKIMVFQGPDPC